MSEETTTLSRGKLIKRAGVGAAAIWSVPFLASTASAGVSIEALRQRCTNSDLSPTCQCGSIQQCATKNGTACFCFAGVKGAIGSGCCECQGNYFCDGAQPCNNNFDCPHGFKCVASCCPGKTCAPACGKGISAAQASLGGKTAAG